MTIIHRLQRKLFKLHIQSLFILSIFSIFSVTNAQDTSFWYINVGNYLNSAEATTELNRLEALGFEGKLIAISENGTSLNQLRIGCFLNESTANSHLAQLSDHLRYPSLSSVAVSNEALSSYCIGYETGVVLPENWQIKRNDSIFLLAITLLDYERLIGFNGFTWQSFQDENSVSDDWLSSGNIPESTSDFTCQNTTSQILNCTLGGKIISNSLAGQLIWQGRQAAIYQNGNTLEVVKIQSF